MDALVRWLSTQTFHVYQLKKIMHPNVFQPNSRRLNNGLVRVEKFQQS